MKLVWIPLRNRYHIRSNQINKQFRNETSETRLELKESQRNSVSKSNLKVTIVQAPKSALLRRDSSEISHVCTQIAVPVVSQNVHHRCEL